MKIFKSKLTLALVIAGITVMGSCKKEEVTPDVNNAGNGTGSGNPVVVHDTLCSGLPGSTDYMPLAIGNKWEYERAYSTGGTNSRTEEIIGDTTINGLDYYTIAVSDYAFTMLTEYINFVRKDANGNYYQMREGYTEHLLIPGTPVVGDLVYEAYEVESTDATVTVGDCTYTGCLRIGVYDIIEVHFYYVPGLGMVESSDYLIEAVSLN